MMRFEIQSLIFDIRDLLKCYSHQEMSQNLVTPQKIEGLLAKIEKIKASPQKLLLNIFGHYKTADVFKKLLIRRLTVGLDFAQLNEDYRLQAAKPHQPYRFSTNSLNRMIKDIFESSKTIEEELTILQESFKKVEQAQEESRDEQIADAEMIEWQLGCLLKLVMQRSDLDIESQGDEMLFRLFILWESLDIILSKTEYVLGQLVDRMEDQPQQEMKSSSTITKRSALSQSVEIYKLSQKKKQEQVRVREGSGQPRSNGAIIRSDYQLVCRGKEKKAEKMINCCCFGQ